MTGEPMRPQAKPTRPRCGQCGKPFSARACGPTHAVVWLESHPRKRPRKPLARKPMRKRRSRRVAAKTEEERRFLGFIHERCVGEGQLFQAASGATRLHRCQGPIQAAHFRDHTGTGRCEPYMTCIGACMRLHDEYDGRYRPAYLFEGWTLDEKKAWHRRRQAEVQAAYAGKESE